MKHSLDSIVNVTTLNKHIAVNAKKINYKEWYSRPKTISTFNKVINSFFTLGKELYEQNKNNLLKIDITSFETDIINNNFLVLKHDYKQYKINKLSEHLYNSPFYTRTDKKDSSKEYFNTHILRLLDILIFSYLLNLALTNYFGKSNELANVELHTENSITLETLFTNYENYEHISLKLGSLYRVYELLPSNIYLLAYHLVKTTSQENESFLSNEFESIHALIWYLTKINQNSLESGNPIIRFCDCLNLLNGRSKRCPLCKKKHDNNRRKINQRKNRALKPV